MKDLKEVIQKFRNVSTKDFFEARESEDTYEGEVDFLAGRTSAFNEVLIQINMREKS